MAEYIERQKAANVLCNAICGSDRGLCVATTENCQQKKMLELYELPAADVVPVVRCRECKHNDKKKQICALTGVHFLENDFCSWGEKSTDNSTQK